MKGEDDPAQLRELLEKRGFRLVYQIKRPRGIPAIDFYSPGSTDSGVMGYVSLERKTRRDAYGVGFGAACVIAGELLQPASARFKSNAEFPNHVFDPPHVMLFNAGRLLGLPLTNIPDPVDPRTPEQLRNDFIAQVLEPCVEGPKNCMDVLDILRRHDPPFEWFLPIRSALYFAATARAVGFTRGQAASELMAMNTRLPGEWSDSERWGNLTNIIISTLWSEAARH